MGNFLDLVSQHPVQHFQAGDLILEKNLHSGLMYVLISGEVEVLSEGVRIARTAKPGVVFGEMSALLGTPHTATVRAISPASFAVIAQPREFLENSGVACFEVAKLLASRLDALNKYLVDVKRQYEGHDHLGMVDEVLEALMVRQPRA